MLRFLSGVVVGVVISEKYTLPKVEAVAKKILEDVDAWSKKNEEDKKKANK